MILLLRDGHRPDYVLFYDGVNDVYSAYQSGTVGIHQNVSGIREKLKSKKLSPGRHIFIGISNLAQKYSMIYGAIYRIAENILSLEEEESGSSVPEYSDTEIELLSKHIIESYKSTAELISYLAQSYSFRYLCFWQPVIFTEDFVTEEEIFAASNMSKNVFEEEKLNKLYSITNKHLHEVSIPNFHNISGALAERTNSMYTDFCHLTEEGNRVMANEIFQVFKREFSLIRASEEFSSNLTKKHLEVIQ